MDILYTFMALLVAVPAIAFIGIIFLTRKRMGYRSIGLAADVTTVLLFFSVPAAISAIWAVDALSTVYSAATVLAIILLIIEWKKTKELELVKLTRKTWRVYFLLLSLAYFLIIAAGIFLAFNDFFQS